MVPCLPLPRSWLLRIRDSSLYSSAPPPSLSHSVKSASIASFGALSPRAGTHGSRTMLSDEATKMKLSQRVDRKGNTVRVKADRLRTFYFVKRTMHCTLYRFARATYTSRTLNSNGRDLRNGVPQPLVILIAVIDCVAQPYEPAVLSKTANSRFDAVAVAQGRAHSRARLAR